MSTVKVDTIKPVTSGADLSLQGDSGGSAVDCLNIDSSGDMNFSGNTDAKIMLPSAGGIYESDGSTAVLTESGGVVTLSSAVALPATTGLSTSANDYPVVRSTELSTLGVMRYTLLGASYYFTTTLGMSSSVWTLLLDWTIMAAATSPANNADPFGKFDEGTGLWLPTIAGYYYCSLSFATDTLAGVLVHAQIRRHPDNDTTATVIDGNIVGISGENAADNPTSLSCSAIIPCDVNDSIGFWGRIDMDGRYIYGASSSSATLKPAHMSIAYLGSSLLT